MAKLSQKIGKALKSLVWEALRFDDFKRNTRNEYPKSVDECIDDNLKYRPGVYNAVRKYRKLKPWQGTEKEMQEKISFLNEELSKIYEIATPRLVFVDKFTTGPCCFPTSKPAVIVLQPTKTGQYSVVCFLHEFAHSLGKDEKGACRWSINLFKRIFPEAYAKLEPGKGPYDGHLLMKKIEQKGKVMIKDK